MASEPSRAAMLTSLEPCSPPGRPKRRPGAPPSVTSHPAEAFTHTSRLTEAQMRLRDGFCANPIKKLKNESM